MSSALRARRILVLDGDRADIGTHDSLLRHSVLYRDLAGYWQVADTAPGGKLPGTRGQSQPAPSAIRIALTRLRAPVFPMIRDR